MKPILASEFDEYVNNLRVLDDEEEENLNTFEGYLIFSSIYTIYIAKHDENNCEPNNTLILFGEDEDNYFRLMTSKPIEDVLKEHFLVSIYDKDTDVLLYRMSYSFSDYYDVNDTLDERCGYKLFYVGYDCGYYTTYGKREELEERHYFKLENIGEYNHKKVKIIIE